MAHVPSAGSRLLLAAAIAFGLAACANDSRPDAPDPSPSPDPSGDVPVNGSERLGWDQRLVSGTRIQDYAFAAYVDEAKQPLNSACEPSGASYSCAAPLPAMSTGRHTLSLVAIRHDGGRQLESDRSAPLVVIKTAAGVAGRAERRRRDAGGLVEVVAAGLGPVADLAVAADGRVFVAERGGVVRIAADGEAHTDEALALSGVETSGGLGLLAIALHPDFARNRYVYLGYAARSTAGPVYRLARSREIGGRLGELAVLLEEPDAGPGGWIGMRFGPDGKLYAAFAAYEGARAASYAGTLLRLEDDGTTPRDHARGSPVVGEMGIVRGLAWSAGDSALLATEWFGGRAALSVRREPAESRPRPAAVLTWDEGQQPAGLAFVPPRTPGAGGGRLLVAMIDGGVQQFRLAPGESGRFVPMEGRLAGEFGAFRAIAVAPGGAVFAGTANGDARLSLGQRPADDVLVKMTVPPVAVRR